jgi:4-hydroxy-tetrahydrodipicolinate reductase
MKLALVGYGKMGRMLDLLAPAFDLEVVARLDAGDALHPAREADAAIEFTTPESAVANLLRLAEWRVPVVCGTTGWYGELPKVQAAVEQHGSALVYSPNFSVGVNVFERIVSQAAALLRQDPDYGAWAWEMHHAAKKDAPSGTLLKLVESMRQAGYHMPVDISSNRAGMVPGTHEIGFDSAADTITLRHTARNREGFARGALRAAQWIAGRQGVFEFSEVLFGGEEKA